MQNTSRIQNKKINPILCVHLICQVHTPTQEGEPVHTPMQEGEPVQGTEAEAVETVDTGTGEVGNHDADTEGRETGPGSNTGKEVDEPAHALNEASDEAGQRMDTTERETDLFKEEQAGNVDNAHTDADTDAGQGMDTADNAGNARTDADTDAGQGMDTAADSKASSETSLSSDDENEPVTEKEAGSATETEKEKEKESETAA